MKAQDAIRSQIEDAREEARRQVAADLLYMRVYEDYRAKHIDKSEARRLALIECGMLRDMAAPRRVRAMN